MNKQITGKIIEELNQMQNDSLFAGVYEFAREYLERYGHNPLLDIEELANVGFDAAVEQWEVSKRTYEPGQAKYVTYIRAHIRGRIADFCELTVKGIEPLSDRYQRIARAMHKRTDGIIRELGTADLTVEDFIADAGLRETLGKRWTEAGIRVAYEHMTAELAEIDAPMPDEDGDFDNIADKHAAPIQIHGKGSYDPLDSLDRAARLMDRDYWWDRIRRLLRTAEIELDKSSLWQVWRGFVYYKYKAKIVAENEGLSTDTVYRRAKLAQSLIWESGMPEEIKAKYAPIEKRFDWMSLLLPLAIVLAAGASVALIIFR